MKEEAKTPGFGSFSFPRIITLLTGTPGLQSIGSVRGTPMAISHRMDPPDVDSQLHSIELEAYTAVLRALTAQGGPTWEQIENLIPLRKELRISDAEHRELRAKVQSDDSVIMIRQWRQGMVGEKELHSNNINVSPSVVSMSHASSKRLKTPHVPLSSYQIYSPAAQPLPAALPSSKATQFSSQYGGEAAIFSSRESVARPKNLVCHNGQALAVGKGMILQSKKGHQVLDVDNSKRRSVSIEIRATTKLIHEVEKLIYSGEYPDPVQVEKAKSLLKEQERAIIDALEKLADLSDDGESHLTTLVSIINLANSFKNCFVAPEGCVRHYEHQQRNARQLATPFAFYEQADNMKAFHADHVNGRGRPLCPSTR
ncbi:hypothetical protein IFM89_003448 [Coptis chinensis]|uniref:ENT domain-containing protein n=1 Tax=Coptis chinensis TaxID=261450 RepID=A0A835LQC6_9MAGN|nr:hypothetical protein IFM89_003448 [Coptis chinensis]